MGLISAFELAIRRALKMSDAGPPEIFRLGLYRARVDAASADGTTLDVTPEDPRISPDQRVPLRVGIPGAVAVVAPGAIVHYGWEAGDPRRAYCAPMWETGATVTKLVWNAAAVYSGGEAGAQPAVLGNTLETRLDAIEAVLNAHVHSGVTAGIVSSGPLVTPLVAQPDVRAANAKVK